MAVLLARLPYGGCVNKWHHLLDVVDQDAIEQGFVSTLERHQVDVPLDRVRFSPRVLQDLHRLLLERKRAWRQQTAKAERFSLSLGKRGPLVERRVLQKGNSFLPGGHEARAWLLPGASFDQLPLFCGLLADAGRRRGARRGGARRNVASGAHWFNLSANSARHMNYY